MVSYAETILFSEVTHPLKSPAASFESQITISLSQHPSEFDCLLITPERKNQKKFY